MNLIRFYHPRPSVTRTLANELFESLMNHNHYENNTEDCKCGPATNVFENEKEVNSMKKGLYVELTGEIICRLDS